MKKKNKMGPRQLDKRHSRLPLTGGIAMRELPYGLRDEFCIQTVSHNTDKIEITADYELATNMFAAIAPHLPEPRLPEFANADLANVHATGKRDTIAGRVDKKL